MHAVMIVRQMNLVTFKKISYKRQTDFKVIICSTSLVSGTSTPAGRKVLGSIFRLDRVLLGFSVNEFSVTAWICLKMCPEKANGKGDDGLRNSSLTYQIDYLLNLRATRKKYTELRLTDDVTYAPLLLLFSCHDNPSYGCKTLPINNTCHSS